MAVTNSPPVTIEDNAVPRPVTILLAEDDQCLRRLLSSALWSVGYDVTEVADGATLLELIADLRERGHSAGGFDVLVTDIHMPALSGLDILAELRAEALPIPVIVMTAFGDAQTHAEAHRLGALAVFDKPFDLDDLRTAIATYAAGRP